MKKKQYYPGSNQAINIFKKNKDTKFEKENLVKNLYDVKKALGKFVIKKYMYKAAWAESPLGKDLLFSYFLMSTHREFLTFGSL